MKQYNKLIASSLCGLCMSAAAMADILPSPPEHPQQDENGVDVRTQTYSYAHEDVSIGPPDHHGLSLTTYLGPTGRTTFDTLLTDINDQGGGTWTDVVDIGNHSESFDWGVPTQGDGSTLQLPGYCLKDGTCAVFGHLLAQSSYGTVTQSYYSADSIQYPDGVVLAFHYRDTVDSKGRQFTRLQSVTTNTGYQMKFIYLADDPGSGSWGMRIKVVAINNATEYCDPNADQCAVSASWPSAQYSGWGPGQYYYETDAGGGQVRFRSDGSAIKTPDSATDNRIYTTSAVNDPTVVGGVSYKVTQAIIDGRVTNYSFAYSQSNGATTVTASAPLSDTRTYVAQLSLPGITSFTNGVNQTTHFTYDFFNRPVTITSPEGNWTQYTYGNDPVPGDSLHIPRGNITLATANPKPGSGQAALSESWVFPSYSNQPSSYTDPRSAQTAYTYHTSGGVLTETLPADAKGIKPVKRYFYAQRYAWIKNSAGAYVQAASPIWLLTEARTCMTSATVSGTPGSCAAGTNDEVVTDYDYGPDSGPNNLLLRGKVVAAFTGTSTVSRRICYGYDVYGNKISETLPLAGLTSCP